MKVSLRWSVIGLDVIVTFVWLYFFFDFIAGFLEGAFEIFWIRVTHFWVEPISQWNTVLREGLFLLFFLWPLARWALLSQAKRAYAITFKWLWCGWLCAWCIYLFWMPVFWLDTLVCCVMGVKSVACYHLGGCEDPDNLSGAAFISVTLSLLAPFVIGCLPRFRTKAYWRSLPMLYYYAIFLLDAVLMALV